MDRDSAIKLLDHGGIVIISGVPKGTEFGIDLSSYNVDDNFNGIKMIPEGPHFIYTSARGTFNEAGSRVGFIHYFEKGDVLFREWDAEKEELIVPLSNSEQKKKQYIRDNVRTFDNCLAPYDYETLKKWKGLTYFITSKTIRSLTPDEGIIRTSIVFMPCTDEERPRGAQKEESTRSMKIKSLADEDLLLPNMKALPETVFKFTEVPPRHLPTASPAEISLSYLDSINAVTLLLDNRENDMIAELQYSFTLYLSGYSIDGLEHWRKIISLLCNSEAAILKFKSFYKTFILILENQLPELPVEVMEPGPYNTIFNDIKKFVRNCHCSGLVEEIKKFQAQIYTKMLWYFDDVLEDDPEDMPVIVET